MLFRCPAEFLIHILPELFPVFRVLSAHRPAVDVVGVQTEVGGTADQDLIGRVQLILGEGGLADRDPQGMAGPDQMGAGYAGQDQMVCRRSAENTVLQDMDVRVGALGFSDAMTDGIRFRVLMSQWKNRVSSVVTRWTGSAPSLIFAGFSITQRFPGPSVNT